MIAVFSLSCKGFDRGNRVVTEKEPPAVKPEALWPLLRGLFSLRRLELLQEVSGALRMGGGREDGAFVVLEDLEPVAEIGGVVLADIGSDAEIGTEEGGTEFRDEFLAGIAFIAEALGDKVTGEPCLMARPVGLMPISA